MEKLDLYIVLSFLLLFIIVVITLIKIHNFMPVYNTCLDDFDIITKCKCIPWING